MSERGKNTNKHTHECMNHRSKTTNGTLIGPSLKFACFAFFLFKHNFINILCWFKPLFGCCKLFSTLFNNPILMPILWACFRALIINIWEQRIKSNDCFANIKSFQCVSVLSVLSQFCGKSNWETQTHTHKHVYCESGVDNRLKM